MLFQNSTERFEYFMQLALKEAEKAFEEQEIPVGAVVVHQNQILAKAHNQTVRLKDPTAHAEMLAITSACNTLGNTILKDCELFVTLEPCVMCSGACYWAMLKRVVYGASDQKYGFKKTGKSLFHPKTEILSGILTQESQALLTQFFAQIRRN